MSFGLNNSSGHPLSPISQDITAAGAVQLQARYVSLAVASGSYAITLAAPTLAELGLVKVIEMRDATGTSVTLALTNVVGAGGDLATFDAVGEHLTVVGGHGSWKALGVTAGITSP